MFIAHRIQLDPTYAQAAYFRRACGTSRFVWNWALAEWKRQYEANEKPSGMSLQKQFNAIKYQQFPWLHDVHRDAHARPFMNLKKAFLRYFKGLGKYPKFKKKGGRDSFYVANDLMRLDGRRIRLPLIGWVRMTEELRFSGKIMSAVVSREADRWFVSIQVDVGDYQQQRAVDGVVGVDLGITAAATLSTGEQIQSPKPLAQSLRRLRRLQLSLSRRQRGSHRRAKQKSQIARVHARIRHIRQDFLHKLTTRLCRENQAVVVEDLCVKGMLRNRRLARSISDVGFGEFRRQLAYKSQIYGTQLIVADRWFPSSKTCNFCGQVKLDLRLSDREYRCDGCGYTADRDLNAARNLRDLCTGGFPGIDARGQDGSGVAGNGCVKPCLGEPRTKPCSSVGTL